ncbi:MAG: sigma 54-interacting transcriptional regulator [Planctomycetaceae bacterium]
MARWALLSMGAVVLVYCLIVIIFVATAHDLGFRFLLVDQTSTETGDSARLPGLAIREFSRRNIEAAIEPGIAEGPEKGDRLLAVARRPTPSFLHYAKALTELREMQVPAGWVVSQVSAADLYKNHRPLAELIERDGALLVEVTLLRNGTDEIATLLPVESVPWPEVVRTLVWFLLVLGVFSVGALAFWARPFDRQARVFFAMCVVTLGGFVGGYHWWVIAGTLWLTIPFLVCAMLVPVVTLHFFLVYPEPKPPLARHPRGTIAALYAVPAAWIGALAALVIYMWWIFDPQVDDARVARALKLLHDGIYVYLSISALYFAATLAALVYSARTTRNPILQSQVTWILWAAAVATLPVGYSLYLAHFRPERFALGDASLPMFTASLLFMLAYAVGIVRYKLMLVDQILSRGMMYYIQSLGVTVAFSLLIALSALAGMYQTSQFSRQAPALFALVAVGVLLLNWSRDRLQQWIDRRFFREKFPIDRALARINESSGSLADPEALAQRLLSSFRDLLGVDHAAFYLRHPGTEELRVVASEGWESAPPRLSSDQELLAMLQEEPHVQRDNDAPLESPSATQTLLQQLDVELVHGLEMDGRLTGLVMLGAKRAGGQYTADDLALLTSLGQITCVALHGARVQQAAAGLNEELRHKLEKISDQQRLISMLQAEITSRQQPPEPGRATDPFRRDLIKGASPAMRVVLDTVRKVAGSQSSVLLRGESGTGKELLAQAIHENSPRRGGPMVSVHCGALSPGLLESELFGHVKGAFTGAHRDKVGRFEMADRGTLFLDEIGDISLDTQIKLLRVLQEREFEPVGGTRAVRVDVRLIAATHQNLERLIAEGRFREDLFYRLNVISIALPPLRDRSDDIIELALHFLVRAAERAGKPITHFDDDALDALRRYTWPGNIRELENAVERAVVMAEGPGITLADLPAAILEGARGRAQFQEPRPQPPLAATARDLTRPVATRLSAARKTPRGGARQELVDALERAGGNKAEAARLLGVPRSTFFSRLRKFGLDGA